MEILECKNEMMWVEAINEWLAKKVQRYAAARIFLPAGDTPRPLYRDWQAKHPSHLNSLTFVQLDEILSGDKKNAFYNFFSETLPDFMKQIEPITAADKGADLALLGIGPNGHVAFHEPGLGKAFYSGCLTLNEETTKRLNILPQTKVVTYGVDAFLRTKAICLIVRGEEKKKILNEILQPDSHAPAAWLKTHPDLTIVTDFAVNHIRD